MEDPSDIISWAEEALEDWLRELDLAVNARTLASEAWHRAVADGSPRDAHLAAYHNACREVVRVKAHIRGVPETIACHPSVTIEG